MADRTAVITVAGVVVAVGALVAVTLLADRPERVEPSPARAAYLREVRLGVDDVGDVPDRVLVASGLTACAAYAAGGTPGVEVGADRDERVAVKRAAREHLCPEVAP